MKPKILFVDDDRYFTDRYVNHLEQFFNVHRINCAENVIEYLSDNNDVESIILDIMMPTPIGVASSATDDGMDTGLWLLYEIKTLLRDRQIPVLIYTNRTDTDVVRERVADMNLPDGLVLIRKKRSRGARDLPSLVIEHLECTSRRGTAKQ